ncbi:FadR/GntR family transcriptional regulator [Microbacterium sp.]|uniref:FadR/GntR family transcriptional regulator n=1 Tax=Microbacterium sp. TaxID=51671 RepID=UPI00333E9A7E
MRNRSEFMTPTEILGRLEQAIVDGEITVGDRLPSERTLAEQFSVSRPVIREALRGLAERGLISVHPGRGSFVREESGDDLAAPLTRLARRAGATPRNIVTARTAIECTAVETAAELRSPERLAELERALAAHEAAETTESRAQTDYDFHATIVAAAENPVLAMMYQAIYPFTQGMMLRSQDDADVRHAGEPQHALIVDAIRAGDADRARELMRRHITLALDLYGADIDKSLEDVLGGRGRLHLPVD